MELSSSVTQAKDLQFQRKPLYFMNQKWQNLIFKMSRIIQIFLFFFNLNNSLAQHFLITSISETLNFIKSCLIFDEQNFFVMLLHMVFLIWIVTIQDKLTIAILLSLKLFK